MTTAIEQDKVNKAEFYANQIKNWQESGMPQKKYCKSVNISYPAFVYWRIKFRGKRKKSTRNEQPTFLSLTHQLSTNHIKSTGTSSEHQIISIILPNGAKLTFPLTVSPTSMADYLKAIKVSL
jgi:hypothetical protein